MKTTLAAVVLAVFCIGAVVPATARETNPQVLADYQKHQAKKHQKTKKHQKKKSAKVERVPMAKLRNCQMKRKWMPPKTIKEVKICEVTP